MHIFHLKLFISIINTTSIIFIFYIHFHNYNKGKRKKLKSLITRKYNSAICQVYNPSSSFLVQF